MSESNDWIELSRDTEAVMVPAGHTVLLPKGTRAVITQSLGGSFTLHVPEYGGLMRISNRDADAVGQEVAAAESKPAGDGEGTPVGAEELETLIWDQLKTCYDPEIPVNIVDLGLVYDVAVSGPTCNIRMTLTSQMCPEARTIPEVVERRVGELEGVGDVEVEIVWEPAWTPQRISAEGRRILGIEDPAPTD